MGAPVAVALGLAGLITVWAFDLAPLVFLPQLLFGTANSWSLLAIPFFILAGNILARGEIARRLTVLARALVGGVRGGLGYVTVAASIFFAGLSGSGPADVAAIGAFLYPGLKSGGYRRRFAAALLAAGGGIGIVIPPSIALVVYGVLAETSIPKLFMAGIFPGLLMGLSLAVIVFFEARNVPIEDGLENGEGKGAEGSIPLGRAFREALWGLGAPVIILGGIYGGVFTPTEAAAVAVAYGLFVGLFVYRDILPRDLPEIFWDSAQASAVVMTIVLMASVFAWVLTDQGIAEDAARGLGVLKANPVLFLLAANAVILAAGCFLDAISIFYIFVPILLPMAKSAGVDPIHLGAILTVNLAIGQITPPVGVNLLVAGGVTGEPLKGVSRGVLPFIAAECVALLVVTFVPQISLWLPSLLQR
jgi:C4-dicarboxylate transporter DctM subunit